MAQQIEIRGLPLRRHLKSKVNNLIKKREVR